MFGNDNPTTILKAQFYGFHCVQCNRFAQMIPIRSNDLGPYFDTSLCAFRYRAERGDERAIEIVTSMEAAVNDEGMI